MTGIDLWLRLGAGGHSVRLNWLVSEAITGAPDSVDVRLRRPGGLGKSSLKACRMRGILLTCVAGW